MRSLPILNSLLLREPDFLRLWAAQTISQFGSQITLLALPLTLILLLDATTFQVSILGVLEFLPFLLFSLPAGAYVDRVRRRPLLIISDWGRAALLASIPIAYFLEALTLAQVYVVGFVVGACTVLFDVTYQSYLPSLVTRENITDANAKLELSRSGAQTAGPALAGILVSAITAPYAILVDALSFVASGVFLTRIRGAEPNEPRGSLAMTELRSDVVDGLRFVVRHPILRWSIAYVMTINFAWSMMFSIYLVFAVRDLDLSPGTIGAILSCGNLGFLGGALSASRLSTWIGIGPALVGSAAFSGLSLLFVPLAVGPLATASLILAGIGFGFCAVVYNVIGVSLMQVITPDAMLGRMNASRRFMVWGVIPAGQLVGGMLGSMLGLRETMWVAAAIASVAFTPLLASPIPRIRTIADGERLVEHAQQHDLR